MRDNVPVAYAVGDGITVIRIANPPVNALSAAVRIGLAEAARRADADPAAAAIVIAPEGHTFIAGADITEFGKPPVPPSLPEVIEAFDAVQKPIVAAIGGAALGGGLEVALGCHARVASPAAKLGLRLLQDPRSRALRHVFFAEREAARIPPACPPAPRPGRWSAPP